MIKQREFLWTNSYDVYDEEGNPSSTFPNSCYPGVLSTSSTSMIPQMSSTD
ncbi:hypothetical protein [Roseburia hominis]|uniref:hypothetical protein n=1 Tax=Roseburia hominis TaxID=301301 RepID=UPI00265AAC3C|nr:hypothetical protein [Roseburia hominis]